MKNLMLIDDDEDDRETFLSVIGNIAAVNCSMAANGREGLDQLVAGPPPPRPDLIFLDLNMPLMDGKQFLTRIKQLDKFRNIPVIILTTSSDSNTGEETFRLGADQFITKPDKLKGWEETLRDALKLAG